MSKYSKKPSQNVNAKTIREPTGENALKSLSVVAPKR